MFHPLGAAKSYARVSTARPATGPKVGYRAEFCEGSNALKISRIMLHT